MLPKFLNLQKHKEIGCVISQLTTNITTELPELEIYFSRKLHVYCDEIIN